MEEDPKAELPSVELANKDWVLKELMETEKRFEKAFHDQTAYLGEKHNLMEKAFHEQTNYLGEKHNRMERALRDQGVYLTDKYFEVKNDLSATIQSQTRWLVGLIVTMTIAIIAAVLFK